MKNSHKYLFLILILILAISIRVFYVTQKKALTQDTPLTFTVSAPTTLDNGKQFKKTFCDFSFEKNREYSGKELKKLLFGTDGTFYSLAKDLKDLYLHDRDDAHSNLYFALIRIWDFNLGANGDITFQTLLWYGVTFNLMIFILSFFVLYKLLQLLTKDDRYILATMFLYSICTGTIACTILIREYQLQTLGFLIVSYIFIYACKSIEENHNLEVFSKKNLVLFSLGFAFLSLTGYYTLLFSFTLTIALIIFIHKKVGLNKTILVKLGVILALTLIFTLLIDPNFFNSINKGYLAHKLASDSTGLRLNPFFIALISLCIILLKTLFYAPAVLLLIGVLIFTKREKKTISYANILFIISLLWTGSILYLAPFFDIKYAVASYPILITGLTYIFSKSKFRYTAILCAIYALSTIYIIIDKSLNVLKPYVFFINGLNEINYNYNSKNLPYVIKYYQWSLPLMILYSNDDTKFIFVDKIPDPNFKHKEYLYMQTCTYSKDHPFDIEEIANSKNKTTDIQFYRYGEIIITIDNTKK